MASGETPQAVFVPRRNIPTAEASIAELLSDTRMVPGSPGVLLKPATGEPIRFADLAQLTINHQGAEFMLTREIRRLAARSFMRWRLYSGTSDQIPAPRFLDLNGPGGWTIVERIVAHTHPRPIPYDPVFIQPSPTDLEYLRAVGDKWRLVFGARSQPFGTIIWGIGPGEITVYGIDSTPGKAVPPPWFRRSGCQS
jgi:hypothetical protein